MAYDNPTAEVLAIGEIALADGNFIPSSWYGHLKFASGKSYTNAILILSEILYWYRPVYTRDEESNSIVKVQKKFKADKLQKSYNDLADKFGLTYKQARDACNFLADQGIISLHVRTITVGKDKIPNRMFIGINPEAIRKINTPIAQTHANIEVDLQVTTDDLQVKTDDLGGTTTKTTTKKDVRGDTKQGVVDLQVRAVDLQVTTDDLQVTTDDLQVRYTENTTPTSTKTSTKTIRRSSINDPELATDPNSGSLMLGDRPKTGESQLLKNPNQKPFSEPGSSKQNISDPGADSRTSTPIAPKPEPKPETTDELLDRLIKEYEELYPDQVKPKTPIDQDNARSTHKMTSKTTPDPIVL